MLVVLEVARLCERSNTGCNKVGPCAAKLAPKFGLLDRHHILL